MKKSVGFIVVLVILAALLLGLGYQYMKEKKANDAHVAEITEAREQLEGELKNLSIGYDSLQTDNEGLSSQIELEKAKIEEMLKEMRSVKNNSYAQITKFKNEITSLQSVLQEYSFQIDSLNFVNAQLTEENIFVKEEIQKANEKITELEEVKTEMDEIIEEASVLEAMNIKVTAQNKRGKKISRARRTKKLETNFILNKNVTAVNGPLDLFVVITRPDGSVLGNPAGEMFSDGETQKVYTAARQVHYGGEYLPVSVFWDNDDSLISGSYDVEVFADGKNIGKSFFSLK